MYSLARRLLRKIYRRAGKLFRGKFDNLSYWEDRVKRFGKLSVLNLKHKPEEIEAVTDFQCSEIFPHLQPLLHENTETILDFGCGFGRFSCRLAEFAKCDVHGADVMKGLLDVAPEHPRVHYHAIENNRIPLDEDSIDVLWIALVLGGIKDSDLPATLEEIHRVLKPNASICLVENTAAKENAEHWYFRSIEQYQTMFPDFDLQRVHTYVDVGEEISVLTGTAQS